jgi:hypothetical protein
MTLGSPSIRALLGCTPNSLLGPSRGRRRYDINQELRYGSQSFWCLIARDECEGVVTDFIGRKRVAFISYDGHSDFLETSRVYHGWEWSIHDGEQGRIVARGETGINALSARQAAEAEWREYRNAPPEKTAIKWRVLKSDVREFVRMAKKKFTSRQAGTQRLLAPKDDPQKLRQRAEELKLKAASLTNEADDLFAKAEQIEAARKQQDKG